MCYIKYAILKKVGFSFLQKDERKGIETLNKLQNMIKINKKGFTLIEILVVIGIIAVLATIVLIAINPARQFAQARDTQRVSNLEAILNAIGQRIADNQGKFNGSTTIAGVDVYCGLIPTTTNLIVTAASEAVEISSLSLLSTDSMTVSSNKLGCLVPGYIPALPFDPTVGNSVSTGYKIVQDYNSGRITVFAPTPEPTITRTAPLQTTR
ncbi:MAG: type II secretion system protein [Candidatus Gottesmanbacteria bacterium]